jgi:hypothetical protein
MTTSRTASTDPTDHDTESMTARPTTKNEQAPEDPRRNSDQDPTSEHTQASGSLGERREPSRAAAKLNCGLAGAAGRRVTDGHRGRRSRPC